MAAITAIPAVIQHDPGLRIAEVTSNPILRIRGHAYSLESAYEN